MLDHNTLWQDIRLIREKAPLVHNITNYVVMNNTANALLALGASPVMAHALEEVEDMVKATAAMGGALIINIGTLSKPWIESMSRAMQSAKLFGIPIVFDPVGAGATPFRTDTCRTLLNTIGATIIRGNASEILALTNVNMRTKGVDSSQGSEAAIESAEELARRHNCVVCVSGEKDIITNSSQSIPVINGHPLMAKVTGMGCTATALIGAFAAINDDPLKAAAHAMSVMGIAGELAGAKANGPGTMQLYFYDALYQLTPAHIEASLK